MISELFAEITRSVLWEAPEAGRRATKRRSGCAVPARRGLISVSLAFATEAAGHDRENQDFVGATPDAVVVLDVAVAI
ncbi:hypothetical protein GCM10012289_07830 [Nonomuraea cavernae]|uniref:Uncharacterized protein n=1 Tax=Nonomuraea cavernae TaxID=2045107 RepID=A0A918DGA8_9ACTN|nr:hypothetical protein GCM10012289_07830 [Nonomuraea cavernae]